MKASIKKKPHYRDFPPTTEDEKTRMWFLPPLGLDNEELKKQTDGVVKVDVTTEEIYETRVYNTQKFVIPPFTFKIFSKRKINGDLLEVYVKVGDCLSIPKTMTPQQYRDEVAKIEQDMGGILDVHNAIV